MNRAIRWLARPVCIALAAACAFACWTGTLTLRHHLAGPPPNVVGDEPEYENLAYQIWQHHRFALDYQDSGFLAAYASAQLPDGEPYAASVAHRLSGLSAYRPPLYPAAMAAIYALVGRHFAAVRVFNLLCAAVTLGLVTWICVVTISPVAGGIAFVVMLLDGKLLLYGRSLLTEDLNAMLVALTLAVLLLPFPERPRRYAVVAGALWGLATLSRTGMILWLPALVLAVAMLALRADRSGQALRRRTGRAVTTAALFALACLVILAPWMVRNIHVLQAAMPLGSQGYMELPAGFSDRAVINQGEWQPADSTVRYNAATLTQYERARALAGKASVSNWIRSHPGASLRLAVDKVRNEWRPSTNPAAWLLLAVVLGLFCFRDRPLAWACAGMIAGDVTMIAATWSVDGRFTFSAYPAFAGLAAAGIWALWRLVSDLRAQVLTPSPP